MIKAGRGPSKLDAKLQPGAVSDHVRKPRRTRKDAIALDAALGRMKDLDVNGDGAADFKELLSFLLGEGYDAPFAKRMMELLDGDGDGEVTEEEWREGLAKLQANPEWAEGMTQVPDPPHARTHARTHARVHARTSHLAHLAHLAHRPHLAHLAHAPRRSSRAWPSRRC